MDVLDRLTGGQTDGRTPDRFIDHALHRPTMRTVSKSESSCQIADAQPYWEAGERVWNTGSPVKYGRSGNPTKASNPRSRPGPTLDIDKAKEKNLALRPMPRTNMRGLRMTDRAGVISGCQWRPRHGAVAVNGVSGQPYFTRVQRVVEWTRIDS